MKNKPTQTTSYALQVVHRKIESTGRVNSTRLEKSILHISSTKSGLQKTRILLQTKKDLLVIRVTDILYAEANGNYTKIFLINNKKHLISKSLKAWLEAENIPFIRCHQSYAVNQEHVKAICDRKYLRLSCDAMIPIARRQYKQTLDTLVINN